MTYVLGCIRQLKYVRKWRHSKQISLGKTSVVWALCDQNSLDITGSPWCNPFYLSLMKAFTIRWGSKASEALPLLGMMKIPATWDVFTHFDRYTIGIPFHHPPMSSAIYDPRWCGCWSPKQRHKGLNHWKIPLQRCLWSGFDVNTYIYYYYYSLFMMDPHSHVSDPPLDPLVG